MNLRFEVIFTRVVTEFDWFWVVEEFAEGTGDVLTLPVLMNPFTVSVTESRKASEGHPEGDIEGNAAEWDT